MVCLRLAATADSRHAVMHPGHLNLASVCAGSKLLLDARWSKPLHPSCRRAAVDTELPRVRAAMASATLVHASETGQLTRALRDAGLQTKAVDMLFAGSGPVILNTTLLPSASPGASNAGESNSSSVDTQGSGSGSGSGSEEGGGSSLSAGAIAALCISCVALVAAVAGGRNACCTGRWALACGQSQPLFSYVCCLAEVSLQRRSSRRPLLQSRFWPSAPASSLTKFHLMTPTFTQAPSCMCGGGGRGRAGTRCSRKRSAAAAAPCLAAAQQTSLTLSRHGDSRWWL